MALPGAGSWNGTAMSAFSAKRRILSLWLPRLPVDRIKRALPDDASVENSRNTAGALPLPLAGEGGGGSVSTSHTTRVERAPTRIASHDAILPPPRAGEVKKEIPSVV